jgi:hypothetical protein
VLNNKTDSGNKFEAIRTRLREKGAAGANEAAVRIMGAGKPAATSLTIGTGPAPKGVPK